MDHRCVMFKVAIVTALVGSMLVVITTLGHHSTQPPPIVTYNLYHVSSSDLPKTQYKDHNHHHSKDFSSFQEKEIKRAIQIFESIGIEGLCHPTSAAYAPMLSLCDDFDYSIFHPIIGNQRNLSVASSPPEQTLLEEQAPKEEHDTADIVFNSIGAGVCIIFVALVASMFLGYLTLEPLDLRIKMRASIDPDERMYARKLLPIIKDSHRLLVTLLLMNAIFYESLPLFLDNLMPSWAAILMSVTVLLIFGEILPSAIITGPYQLKLASQLTPILKFFMWVLHPVAKPLTMLLDYLVPTGSDSDDESDVGEGYHRGELSALIRIQYEDQQERRKEKGTFHRQRRTTITPHYMNTVKDLDQHRRYSRRTSFQKWQHLKQDIQHAVEKGTVAGRESSISMTAVAAAAATAADVAGGGGGGGGGEEKNEVKADIPPPLHHSEVKMVEGALTMKTKCVLDVYTPLRKLFSIPSNLELDQAAIASIYGKGYSRVPVYNPDGGETAIEGILITRQLIMIDWDDERPVSTLPLLTYKNIPIVHPKMNLVDLLRVLQQGTVMALVCSQPVVARSALKAELPLPPAAGFMGVVTLEDVMEEILQETIYDEGDIAAEHLAAARLTQWWQQLQNQDDVGGESRRQPGTDGTTTQQPDEETPLLA